MKKFKHLNPDDLCNHLEYKMDRTISKIRLNELRFNEAYRKMMKYLRRLKVLKKRVRLINDELKKNEKRNEEPTLD